MDPRTEVESSFKVFGVELSSDILTKCEEICLQHHVTGDEFVDTWMAFTLSNLHGAEPTLDYLVQFERKHFAKASNRDVINKNSARRPPARGSPLVVYGSNNTKDAISDDLINTYCTTPKRKAQEKRAIDNVTPEERFSAKRQISAGRSPRVAFSPASYSPVASTPSSSYTSRANAGEVVCELGRRPAGQPWKPRGPMASLQVAMYGRGPHLGADARFMYEKLRQKAYALSDRIDSLGVALLKQNKLRRDENFCSQIVDPAVGVGRVCCDANGRLNASSILLEGSYQTTYGASMVLKVLQVPSYSLFPGQIVAVEGTNPSGEALLATKVYSNAAPEFPDEPIKLKAAEGPLHIVAAAGPYTQMDTMTYQPLEDLMEYVRKNEPHVLILVGPLLDANHEQVKENTLAEPFDVAVDNIIDGIAKSLKGLHTKVVLVASARDVHHQPVFPTPPYKRRAPHPDILFAPDPCLLDLGGVVVGVTATDVIKHISKEEICNPPQGGDRLGRLASHLLSQRSFYPLYPSSEDVHLDFEMSEQFCELPVKPHVLILPSDLRYFIKDVNGCVVANPERLSKGKAGGTFVRFEIKPIPENNSLIKSTVAEVVRI